MPAKEVYVLQIRVYVSCANMRVQQLLPQVQAMHGAGPCKVLGCRVHQAVVQLQQVDRPRHVQVR